MHHPTTIFIDTNIFDKSSYNFSSKEILAFLDVIKKQKLKLLLPDPTKREIMKHIKDSSHLAMKSLKDAQRRTPFLAKLENWPLKNSHDSWVQIEINKIANEEFKNFLLPFDVKNLDYKNIDLNKIMNWYERIEAPFGEGKKRKEFPDAFALAILLEYAKKTGNDIAVISADNDFEKACNNYPSLLYYQSLASYTETLLSGDTRITIIHGLLEENATKEKISDSIADTFSSLDFILDEVWNASVAIASIDDIELENLSIVGLGHKECTVAFKASIEFSVNISCNDFERELTDGTHIDGIFKLKLNDSLKTIEKITTLDIDQSVITITDDYEYYDYDPEHPYY